MKKFRKVWDDTKNNFIKEHREMVKQYKDFYAAFIKAFPDSEVTYVAFKNQCSRLGVTHHKNPHVYRAPRPLYAEHQKKGYVRIKIAQPNVWVSKAKWVYMETHPWEDFSESSEYIFLDGDTRNFHPDNIGRLPRKCQTIFANLGGNKGGPEIVRLRIAQSIHKYALLDAGEKLGLVVNYKAGRRFRDDVARAAREQYKKNMSTEEGRQKIKASKKTLY